MAELIPVVVELDGALLSSSLSWEHWLFSIKQHVFTILQKISAAPLQKSSFDVSTLPYDEAVLSILREEHAKGRSIILLTSNNFSLAMKIAEFLKCISEVKDISHLSQQEITANLKQEFGYHGFDIIVHNETSMMLSEIANKSFLVKPSNKAIVYTQHGKHIKTISEPNKSPMQDWLYELRLHQWVKNFLIFIPLLTSHQVSLTTLGYAMMAFLLFGCCSSSAYLLNDLLDLAADRVHKTKRNRPFAAGRLAISTGLITSPTLLLIAIIVASLVLPTNFLVVLLVYYVVTLAYSLFLKRYMAIDVVVLAILYTLRIVAGGAALSIVLTSWILAFAIFIFLSLALVKRYIELNDAQLTGENTKVKGRGYYASDLSMIAALGAAAGYLSVMVLALYINSPQVAKLYSHTEIIWLACPILLFWVTRLWFLAHRGELHSDPVVFAIKDRVSLLAGGLFILVFWIAI